jgi:hypothetical protein
MSGSPDSGELDGIISCWDIMNAAALPSRYRL